MGEEAKEDGDNRTGGSERRELELVMLEQVGEEPAWSVCVEQDWRDRIGVEAVGIFDGRKGGSMIRECRPGWRVAR